MFINIIIAIGIICGLIALFLFFQSHPLSSSQLKMIKEWLLYAVTKAEKELGSGTGQIKLRYVYSMFIEKFPKLAKRISFDIFSNLVDEVLNKFEALLRLNAKVKIYVNKEDK